MWQHWLTMATSMCRFRLIFGKLFNTSLNKRCFYHGSRTLRTFITTSCYSTNVLNYKLCYVELASKSQVAYNGAPSRFLSTDKKLSAEEIKEKVLKVCQTFDKIPTDQLTLDSHFMNDLGLDSLDHVELIMNIEDDFNFEIPDADAEKLLRPRDIIAYIEQKEASSSK